MWAHLPKPAVRGAYRAQQASIRNSLILAHGALRALSTGPMAPSAESLTALRREYDALLDRDLENVEAGLYPADLLFQLPLLDYALTVPRFVFDLPRTIQRIRNGAWRDLPADVADRYDRLWAVNTLDGIPAARAEAATWFRELAAEVESREAGRG